jgi:hypothetical protein
MHTQLMENSFWPEVYTPEPVECTMPLQGISTSPFSIQAAAL